MKYLPSWAIGLLSVIIGGLVAIEPLLTSGQPVTVKSFLTGFGFAVIGLLAKQFNVTGGTVSKTDQTTYKP
jgi:hypothetical protein